MALSAPRTRPFSSGKLSEVDVSVGQTVSAGQVLAKLDTAQNNLQGATLVAPTGGTIASLNGTVGQWIGGGATSSTTTPTASTTTPVGSAFVTLMGLTAPQISASVSEADIGRIQAGQKVNFTVTAFPGRTFSGTVAAVEPAGTTTSNVVTYIVLVSADATDVQLLPDMTATLTIITQQASNAIVVPNSTAGTIQALPMGEYLKAILTGQNLPADLASEAASSPLLRAAELTIADLTGAFVPDAG